MSIRKPATVLFIMCLLLGGVYSCIGKQFTSLFYAGAIIIYIGLVYDKLSCKLSNVNITLDHIRTTLNKLKKDGRI